MCQATRSQLYLLPTHPLPLRATCIIGKVGSISGYRARLQYLITYYLIPSVPTSRRGAQGHQKDHESAEYAVVVHTCFDVVADPAFIRGHIRFLAVVVAFPIVCCAHATPLTLTSLDCHVAACPIVPTVLSVSSFALLSIGAFSTGLECNSALHLCSDLYSEFPQASLHSLSSS